jgi:gamma-glutamylcyclotransferase (GGCT)/AIG2-like uncharacterized protein YtfP
MINQAAYLPLFVYGTLLSGQPAFHLIAHAVERFAPAKAPGLVMHNVGRYPIAVPGQGQIVGEVHWLYPERYVALLAELDEYEGAEYKRQVYTALLTGDQQTAEVWIFVGDPVYAARFPLVPDGDWRRWVRQSHSA